MPTQSVAGGLMQQRSAKSPQEQGATRGIGIDPGRLVWLGLAVAVAAAVARQVPDLRRYMNMRRM